MTTTDGARIAHIAFAVLGAVLLVAAPGAALLTWFPSTRHATYRPRGWAPFVGIGVVAAAWLVAVELFPVI